MARAIVFVACLGVMYCSKPATGPTGPTGPDEPPVPPPVVPGPPLPPPPLPPPGPEVFVGAGDIAACAAGQQEQTARLLDTIGGNIFTLGDNVYSIGSREDFRNCYDRSWGRHRGRTHPAPGNHDYMTLGAAGYFEYFGESAGPSGLGYYSFNLGAWHIVSLNSNFDAGVGVGNGSPQYQWLQADLAASQAKCTLAYWHHPLFTSGQNRENPYMRPIFGLLYDANADVVLTGHDHLYERFAPQAPDGRNDPARGIREFVVGTGGVPLYQFVTTKPNSEVRINNTVGVLKLTLRADNYQWELLSPGGIPDSGIGSCH